MCYTPSHTNVCKFLNFQLTFSHLILHLKCWNLAGLLIKVKVFFRVLVYVLILTYMNFRLPFWRRVYWPGCFRLLFLLSFIRKTKNAQLKKPTDLLHKNLMKPRHVTHIRTYMYICSRWRCSPQVSYSSMVRASNRYLEGHGFDSHWGLRIFWVFRLENASSLFKSKMFSVKLPKDLETFRWLKNWTT